MDGQPQQDASRYMVVRSESDGQLSEFESVNPHQSHIPRLPFQVQQDQARSQPPPPLPASTPMYATHSRQQSRGVMAARSRSGSSQGGHSRGHSRTTSAPRTPARTRTNTVESNDDSITSESEFITHWDSPHQTPQRQQLYHQACQNQQSQPYVGGHQYGPYSYLNDPQNMVAERFYSQESLRMQRNGSNSGSGSSQGHVYHPNQVQGSNMSRGAPAPMMHKYSSSSSSFDSYGSAQGFQKPYATRSTARLIGTPQGSSLGHDSVQVLAQPNYAANHALETHFLYDAKNPEHDDYLHNPATAQHDAIIERRTCSLVSIRGFLNVIALVLIILALIGMFGAYPIIQEIYSRHLSYMGGFGLGGTNSSGQVPVIPNLPGLIDSDTPESAFQRTGFDNQPYNLVFSDEFEQDGRTFYPGDDPYWEAVDLHYWATGDYEWNDPDAITTKDGYLEITMSKQPTHGFDYQGGMLQSWNKLCFTGGFIEVSVSLPGTSQISGFWPGVWTMGNLARAGYGATTEGVWPYSYEACDVGTLKNQTMANGNPAAAAGLSFQPGQKASACTCKGQDHPGPNVRVGRGAPEIDIIEAQSVSGGVRLEGEVSQSAQIAPYDDGYKWKQSSPASTIFNSDLTKYNPYTGGNLQEAVSALTMLEDEGYEVNGGFKTYGFEYRPGGDEEAFITWMYNDKPTWKVTAATFPADPVTQVSQRMISQEPMSIIMNFHMSDSFQTVDLASLPFPSKFRIDYVRVYQREGEVNLSCDPEDYPTADYIIDHLNAYSNPNLTTWKDAGYNFPKNRLVDDC